MKNLPSKQQIKRIFQFKIPFIIGFYLLWIFFFDSNNLISLFKLNKEIQKFEGKKAFFEKEIAEQETEHDKLTSDIQTCIDYGRKNLYLKEKDDVIFVTVKDTPPPPQTRR